MRLGIDTSDEFIKNLSEKSNEIQTAYSKKMEKLTSHVSIKAMLGDSTITQTKTFDPMQIQNFYKNISENLQNWNTQDVTMTNNEDIRRIFIKFDSQVGNYLLSGHMSIQFHVLLYYKQDNKVIQYQKELSEIIDRTKTMDSKLGDDSDQFILQKLKELGYTDLNHQNLFEVFFENDKLREKIYEEIEKNTDLDFKKLAKRKMDLFNELDSLLIETYQTSNVLIDDTRLIAGEEGYLCNFDLEFIKNKVKEGKFVPKKIPNDIKENLIKKLDEIKKIIET
ncbi:MAG: hypothetical protein V3U12_03690 [Nitrosopumilaceae archaeon]